MTGRPHVDAGLMKRTVCIIVRLGAWIPPGNLFTVVLLTFLYFTLRGELSGWKSSETERHAIYRPARSAF